MQFQAYLPIQLSQLLILASLIDPRLPLSLSLRSFSFSLSLSVRTAPMQVAIQPAAITTRIVAIIFSIFAENRTNEPEKKT